jgi:helix-turn-helix protein
MNLAVRISMFVDVEEYQKEVSIGRVTVSSLLCNLIAIDEGSKVFDEDKNDPPVEKIGLKLTVSFKRLLEIYKEKMFMEAEIRKFEETKRQNSLMLQRQEKAANIHQSSDLSKYGANDSVAKGFSGFEMWRYER